MDHHPTRVAVDAQVLHVLQTTGQGRGIFEQHIGRATAVRDDIARECAVANPQITFSAGHHVHQNAVAGRQRRTIEDRNIGLRRASTDVIDDNRRTVQAGNMTVVQFERGRAAHHRVGHYLDAVLITGNGAASGAHRPAKYSHARCDGTGPGDCGT
ncbi:hypothetical protein D3C76_907180 [compost metagenome]